MKQNPPPKTIPRKIIIKQMKDSQIDIAVYAEVLRDSTNNKIKGGETSFDPVGAIPDGKKGWDFLRAPGYSWEKKGGQKIVKKLNAPVEIKGTIKIQTTYNPSASPTDLSAYGRGTTPEDEKTGNTSLGFHECRPLLYLEVLRCPPPIAGLL